MATTADCAYPVPHHPQPQTADCATFFTNIKKIPTPLLISKKIWPLSRKRRQVAHTQKPWPQPLTVRNLFPHHPRPQTADCASLFLVHHEPWPQPLTVRNLSPIIRGHRQLIVLPVPCSP
ncbi:hypothetical protein J6590_018435 [Homalodisca vitripennis]|nr:hypothetical protein J6590_018435 [Homalodisca vitripennis]